MLYIQSWFGKYAPNVIPGRKADAKASSIPALSGLLSTLLLRKLLDQSEAKRRHPFLGSLSLLSGPLVGWWDDGKWKREETVSRFEADPARPDYSAQGSGTLDGTDSVPITQHHPPTSPSLRLEMGGTS